MRGRRWGSDWKANGEAGRQARRATMMAALSRTDPSAAFSKKLGASSVEAARAARNLAAKGRMAPGDARAFGEAFSRAIHMENPPAPTHDSRGRPVFYGFEFLAASGSHEEAGRLLREIDQLLLTAGADVRASLAAGLEGGSPCAGFGLCGLWLMRALLSDDAEELSALLGAGVDPFALALCGHHPLDAAWLCGARRCAMPLATAAMRLEQPWIERRRQAPPEGNEWDKLLGIAPPIMSSRFWPHLRPYGCAVASRAPVLVPLFQIAAAKPGQELSASRALPWLWRPARRPEPFERGLPPMEGERAMAAWLDMARDAERHWSCHSNAAQAPRCAPWIEAVAIRRGCEGGCEAGPAPSAMAPGAGRPRL